MKIIINIKKWNLILIIGIIGVFAGIIFGFAYNPSFSGGNPPVFGHSADELDVAVKNSTGSIVWLSDMQSYLENMPGQMVCRLNKTEVYTVGCPVWSYISSYSSTGNSTCTFFFTTIDNSAQAPVCYPTTPITTIWGGGCDGPPSHWNYDPCCVGTGAIRTYCQ